MKIIFSNGTAVECNEADECTERTIPFFGSELEDGFQPYENYRGKFETKTLKSRLLIIEFNFKLVQVVETDNENYALIVTCLNVTETQVGF